MNKKDRRNGYVEICQTQMKHLSQAANPNGRRSVKIVLHEIYSDATHWNENGITYLEKYTRDNAESVKGMPLCAQFFDDDKEIPYGHGMTGRIGNMPTFEDSVQVGVFNDWSIEDIEVNGRVARCLCATGYLNEARYPNLVNWVIEKWNNNDNVYGSVEFVGTKENDGEIIYDGGWKKQGRIPMVYDYSGYCILSIRPADSAAILVEMNQSFQEKLTDKEKTKTMVELNEDVKSVISEVKSEVISAIKSEKSVEANAQITEKDNRISDLDKKVDELNQKIEELNATIKAKDDEIAELNKRCSEANDAIKQKETEMNAQLTEAKQSNDSITNELNELKKANKIAELNTALASYDEVQRTYAKDEIDAFNADPFSVEINSITTKIDAVSYQKIRENQAAQHKAEINSKNEFDEIMANVDPIVNDEKEVEDFDVFA